MLQSLHIENFRGFQEFDLENLGRINLLVGENNSGKTSILEAILLFLSKMNFEILSNLMNYRGEYVWSDKSVESGQKEYLICHLFYGHNIISGSKLLFRGDYNNNKEDLSLKIDEIAETKDFNNSYINEMNARNLGKFNLNIDSKFNNLNSGVIIPLSTKNNLPEGLMYKSFTAFDTSLKINTKLINPLSLDIKNLIELFDNIVLSPNEQFIIEALQIIEPKIERIASVGQEKYSVSSRNYGERGGFLVKFSDQKQPIPIGSLGDGIWRILAIILTMVNLENGVLLVDEIDTGLHFSTLLDMWKVILFTARKLNIQLFATTHNSDCWKSLAPLIEQEKIEENEITIQRIEPDRKKSVSFNTKQIVIAEERDIEVR